MTNHQDAALEVAQRERERVHGFDVQVVGRLVQDEDVRVREREAGERHAGFLAAGEERHFLEAGHARYAEAGGGGKLVVGILRGRERVDASSMDKGNTQRVVKKGGCFKGKGKMGQPYAPR